MLFVEPRFFVFFLLVFGVHWALRSNTARKVWLLVCSHVFYACFFIGHPGEFLADVRAGNWEALPEAWWFPAVFLATTFEAYAVGRGIAAARSEAWRKCWLIAGLAFDLGVLCFFKYFNFFTVSASEFLRWAGLGAADWTLRIFLPFGISFYTFQSMSYTIDVYRRRIVPLRSYLDLGFYLASFPHIVAGPIVRAVTFLPQVVEQRRWRDVDVRGALALFFVGFLKKACVSEMVAPIVDDYFAAPQQYDAFSAWIAVLFYAVQIYCDFSGYTDMAIGAARLLGYELTINFTFPYLAANITEFWRRWHISLSTWLREYLYVPLGGNRGSKWFTYRNIMLTMLLGGLWHGASWNFVFWGALHGAALIVHREWQRLAATGAWLARAAAAIAVPLTFVWVCIAWIPFRATELYADGRTGATLLRTNDGFQDAGTNQLVHAAEDMRRDPLTGGYRVTDPASGEVTTVDLATSGFGVTRTVLGAFVLLEQHGTRRFGAACPALFLGLALVHWLCYRKVFAHWWRALPDWAFAAVLGAGAALALCFVPARTTPFIYFQF
jgi:alginate O-acetyltransferase complex protein AlgI